MKPRVTAIVVARESGAHLEQTLAAIAAQTRKVDAILAVDNGSKGKAGKQFGDAGLMNVSTTPGAIPFGEAVETASRSIVPTGVAEEFIWLLAQDSAPAPDALEQLLAALEISPSVAVVGPKVMDWDDPDTILEFGLSTSPGGRTISLVHDELDQGQHDLASDVLAVGANGMLVREPVWRQLDGFDPGLPVVDDALDFCIRARLLGYRITVVPGAKVMSAGDGVIGFLRSDKFSQRQRRHRATRRAQLYRRLVYARGMGVFWHWLGLLPSALARVVWDLLAKRPNRVGGELRASLQVAFSGGSVARARGHIARTRTASWAVLGALILSPAEVRRRDALVREAIRIRLHGEKRPVHFFQSGGAWVTLILLVTSVAVMFPILGATTIEGGALLPLSTDLAAMWAQIGYGWRFGGIGLIGPADPFALFAAVLGSLTWWQPSLIIVILWYLAIPLAGVGAWLLAARLTERASLRAFVGLAYGIGPALLLALSDGRPTAVIAHILLPWLFVAGFKAPRSWSAAATTSLVFAAIVACAPSLTPALLIVWLGSIFLTGRAAGRFLAIPLPATVLFFPLIWVQLFNGNVLGIFADPGNPVAFSAAARWELALGFPTTGLGGWISLTDAVPFGIKVAAGIVAAVLVGVVAVLGVAGLFSSHPIRAQLSIFVALLGLVTAVAAVGLNIAFQGSVAVAIWPGAGLSLAWLGLIVAAMTGMSVLRRFSIYPAMAGMAAVIILVLPALSALMLGQGNVQASNGRTLPAYVVAQASSEPRLGTLILTPQPDGSLATALVRSTGYTLNNMSTLVTTGVVPSANDLKLADIAGNLTSQSGRDTSADLTDAAVAFVLLTPAQQTPGSTVTADAREMTTRATQALNANPTLEAVGDTADGLVWRFPSPNLDSELIATPDSATQPWRSLIILIQLLVLIATVLLAIPTGVPLTDTRPARFAGLDSEPEEIDWRDPLGGEQDDEQN